MERLEVTLPWPPSANNSKTPLVLRNRHGRLMARQVSSAALRHYKGVVAAIVRVRRPAPVRGAVCVTIEVVEPNRLRRDIANLEKAPIDALVEAGVIEDDCLIDRLVIYRSGRIKPPGHLVVTIEQMER